MAFVSFPWGLRISDLCQDFIDQSSLFFSMLFCLCMLGESVKSIISGFFAPTGWLVRMAYTKSSNSCSASAIRHWANYHYLITGPPHYTQTHHASCKKCFDKKHASILDHYESNLLLQNGPRRYLRSIERSLWAIDHRNKSLFTGANIPASWQINTSLHPHPI